MSGAGRMAKWGDPAWRARWEAAHAASLARPEVRSKMSAAQRRRFADAAGREWLLAITGSMTPAVRALCEEHLRAGRGVAEVAADFLISEKRVCQIRKEMGLVVAAPGRRARWAPIEARLRAGDRPSAIAADFGVTTAWVRRLRQKLGVVL